MIFEKHIFICTNQRDNGKASCGETNGMALVKAFQNEIADLGLRATVRAQRAGCLDVCDFGPALDFYDKNKLSGICFIIFSILINTSKNAMNQFVSNSI